MKIPATLLLLSLVAIISWSGLAQPSGTLRVFAAENVSESGPDDSTSPPQEAELKQLKRLNAILLAEKKQLLSDHQDLEKECVALQNKLGNENAALTKQMKLLSAEKINLMAQVDQLNHALKQARKENGVATADLHPPLSPKDTSPTELDEEKSSMSKQLETLTAEKNQLARQLLESEKQRKQAAADFQQQLAEQQRIAQAAENKLQQSQAALAAAAEQLKTQDRQLTKRSDEKTALTSRDAEPPGLAASETAELERLVKRWSKAWSAQNAEEYLSFYSPDFSPPGSLSRATWESKRRSRLKRPKFIIVSLEDISVDVVDPSFSRINFIQIYKSNTYSDRVAKQLELKKEQGEWKILSEVNL